MGEVNKLVVPAQETGPTAPAAKTPPPATPPVPATDPNAPVRPEWCPEKFWKEGKVDSEGLAKSFAEAEKKITQQGQQPPKSGEQPPATTEIAGVPKESLAKFTDELSKDGKLSDTSYAELAKVGYSKSVVDAYVRGLSGEGAAVAEKIVASVQASVGGEQSYTDLVTWAASNLNADEQTAYNKAVTSGNEATMRIAVEGLQARYNKANGVEGKMVDGNGDGSANAGDVFESVAQLQEAMRDPRYKKDPAYRKAVEQKIGRSSVL